MTNFEKWMLENQDTLSARWLELLHDMQDSCDHKMYLYNSDKCFIEWCEEKYLEESEK